MDYKNLIKELANSNDYDYNLIKACEELAELQEVLLKKIIKKGGAKEPSNESIIEELGDVRIRIDILSELFGVDQVSDRIKYKYEKYIEYLRDSKYKGKI